MPLKLRKTEVWTAAVDDRPGGAAGKLEALAQAGANLEMVFARRTPEQPGRGILFAGPIKGRKVTAAAQAAGFEKAAAMHGLSIEGGDKAGLGAKITRALAGAGVSFRGMSASAIGRKFVCHVVMDSADDVARAIAALKKARL